ncbi:hypothetical protein D1007_12324 [Hordeum vulgare]|nr:hypothetical protein D1007_12324 [Hordeum vulgare]
MCSEPTTLAALMAKADKYATADSTMQIKVNTTDKPVQPPATMRPASDGRGQQNNKRKSNQLDPRHRSKKVATVEDEQPAA